MSSNVRVELALGHELPQLAALFDAYRQFYEQPSDLPRALRFLQQRQTLRQALLWGAWSGTDALGLCQCYPTFCSVIAEPIWVLYDLYVHPDARGQGVAHALMAAVEEAARQRGVARLDLTTAHTNTTAQALYESRGWERDLVFRTYTKTLSGT
ncbi:GNAT family N-acetyltransferase [Roseateles sp. BYS180W]|uniref:GNAT family N-acetyltransferase n=1 Tax=Roseateles rivi TaxID=3299028 RepID=A0ABW7FSK0_9BURK